MGVHTIILVFVLKTIVSGRIFVLQNGVDNRPTADVMSAGLSLDQIIHGRAQTA